MSRIGKMPINIPAGVTVNVTENSITLTGPKGNLTTNIPERVKMEQKDGKLFVVSESGNLRGLVKSLVSNTVKGITEGWTKSLELTGTGYRAAVAGGNLQLALGFSHPVVVKAPAGIAFEVKDNKITVSGADKIMVGQMAATIRDWKPADPYKAKGLKYEGEVIIKKAGKAAKAGGAK